MIDATDVVRAAARDGLVLSASLVSDAFASVDRKALESAETARYKVLPWDGTAHPPVSSPERWLHGKDAASQAAQRAFREGGVVYFLLRDGDLLLWQPWRADQGHTVGRHMVKDPGHPDNWEDAAKRHVASIVEAEVDGKMVHAVIGKALELHEQRGVPYHGAAPRR